MPAERLSMRKVREVLRMKYAGGASERVIARSVGVGRTAIGEYSPHRGDRHHLAGTGRNSTTRRWSASCSRRPATTHRDRSRFLSGGPAVRQKLHLSPCADFRDRL